MLYDENNGYDGKINKDTVKEVGEILDENQGKYINCNSPALPVCWYACIGYSFQWVFSDI